MRHLLSLLLFASALALNRSAKGAPLELHVVPTSVKSYRLLAMSMDDDGFIWAGSIHRLIHRYDPRTGALENIPLPYDSTTSSCICAGKKVYLLGQAYPRLMIYDRAAKKFSEVAYPSAKPDVWYGTELVDGRYLYLFDRGSAGVIRWDTINESGKVLKYPYPTLLPSSGRHVAEDQALWCAVWDFAGGQYRPVGIARLDLKIQQFTGWYPFPKPGEERKPYGDAASAIFYPDTLKGRLVPFDWKEKRWCAPIEVPGYGERFGFLGLATVHDGRWFFSLSTYNGTELGCDGKPYHFCNGLLEFDPRIRAFTFHTLESEHAYYQVAYALSADGHFFATGSNIRQPDGTLNQAQAGEVVFWQTRKVEPK